MQQTASISPRRPRPTAGCGTSAAGRGPGTAGWGAAAAGSDPGAAGWGPVATGGRGRAPAARPG